MSNIKKTSWFFLYLSAFLPVIFSIDYLSEKNLLSALIASSISMFLYTLIIIKGLRFLSSISFFTMLLASLLTYSVTLDTSENTTGGIFSSAYDERASMLILSFLIFTVLANFVFWARTKLGFKKLISRVGIFLSVLSLIAFGVGSPSYYQNFVYTRVFILILLVFSVLLIVKRKKILGVLGILLSIGVLLLSAAMFSGKTYSLDDKERKEVIAYVDPMAKEMFRYYNEEDYDNFCKYCGFFLRNMLEKNPIKTSREKFGPYVHFDEPSKVVRKGGRFYVEYPVKFQNEKDLIYLIFVTENISSTPIIYGFAFAETQEK